MDLQNQTREKLVNMLCSQKSIQKETRMSMTTINGFFAGKDISAKSLRKLVEFIEDKTIKIQSFEDLPEEEMYDCSRVNINGVIINVGDKYCNSVVFGLKSNVSSTVIEITTKENDRSLTWTVKEELIDFNES